VRSRLLLGASLAALALPGSAIAHGRNPVLAIDYRLALARQTLALPGVRVGLVDGDRALRVSVAPGIDLLVRGELGEPLLRIDRRGVFVDASSPTATSDGLVSPRLRGWVRVCGGDSVVWHDHRLVPPPRATPGADGGFTIPVLLDGRPASIAGSFYRVGRPPLLPWLLAAGALAAAIALTARRLGGALTVALGLAGGLAALAAVASFAAPVGGAGAWLEFAAALALGAVLAALLLRRHGRARARVAGVVGGLAAVVSLGALSVFRHGVVVSALPAPLTRLACGLALECGLAAAALSLLGARAGAGSLRTARR
jgi:hypothetical protein